MDEVTKKQALSLARNAIKDFVYQGKFTIVESDLSDLRKNGGAFVTVKVDSMLRGCIGYLGWDEPLYKVIQEKGVAAASIDPRFSPIYPNEINRMTIEISILSPLQKVNSYNDIILGVHGLMIVNGIRRGVLLPHVPLEYHWDLATFLEHLCLKAGLQINQLESSTLYKFSAEKFQEA